MSGCSFWTLVLHSIPPFRRHWPTNKGLEPLMCNWVLGFLTGRPQSVKIHVVLSSTTVLNACSPQGCVLNPLLYALLTYDCSARYPGKLFVVETSLILFVLNLLWFHLETFCSRVCFYSLKSICLFRSDICIATCAM